MSLGHCDGRASAADLRRVIVISVYYDDRSGRVLWFVIGVLRAGAAGDGITLTIALTVHLDDSGVVHEAVYGRDCHGGTWENVRPSGERLVGGDGDGVSFVSVSDELEQGTGLHLVLSHIGQLMQVQ